MKCQLLLHWYNYESIGIYSKMKRCRYFVNDIHSSLVFALPQYKIIFFVKNHVDANDCTVQYFLTGIETIFPHLIRSIYWQKKLNRSADTKTYVHGNYCDFSINLYTFRNKSHMISSIIHTYLQCRCMKVLTFFRSFYHTCNVGAWKCWLS